MRNILKIFIILSLIIGFSVVSAVAKEDSRGPRKIVIFKEGLVNIPAQSQLLRNFGATIVKPLRLVSGIAVYLPPQAEAALRVHPQILRIDDDIIVEAIGKPKPTQPPQDVPWGISRIGADLVWAISPGADIKLAIVDTGIDLDHPDLMTNISGQVNTINPLKTGDDDNGHGTHVSGTVAALNNTIGVVGVGPQINLYAVKVLGRNGSGFLSDVVEGLQWCVANGMQVVNMSLGASSDVQTFHDAVVATYAAGITQVAAAGNSGGSVAYPAAYPEVIAVSATDSTDTIASFSSRGPEVDLAAPGVGIKSTYKGGYYKTLNGTSMAAPHVSGAAAVTLAVKGPMTPDDLKVLLEVTAEDLGDPGKDNLYGAGLVDVYKATQ